MVCTYIFQVPLDLNEFHTNDADALPLLHFILQLHPAYDEGIIHVAFLSDVIGNANPYFATSADGLDCALKSSSGQKAGEMFPRQATAVLCMACKEREVTVVKGMLAAGTNVNQCDEDDLSPLMHASTEGKLDVIDVLVSHGADVNFVNKKNQTSLLLACENKKWNVAIALYQHIMATDAGKSTEQRSSIDKAFQIAIQHHGVKYLQHVAENDHCAYDSLVSKVSFSDACKHGYDLVVKHHVHHQDYSQIDITDAVKIAHSNNQSDVLNTLIPHLTNSSVSELITHAYQQADCSFALKLFESCADHSTLPCPDLSITDACKARQVDVVEFLIKHGKDVNNAADELGYRLNYQLDDGDALLHVLKASAEDNQTDDNVYSPTKVDISLSVMNDHNCHPPLVYACMQGDISIVKLLLQHGADVNIYSDETPLTAACKHGHSDVVDILLHNTPNPSICQTNMYGMTPLQVAVKYHQGVIARRLIDIYEADPNVCKTPNTEFIKVTLMLQDRLKSVSVVKLQAISQDITSIVSEYPNWEICLKPVKTEDAGTLPIVAAFQSKQYGLVKFFIEHIDNYEPVELFKHAMLEDICQLEKVPFVQKFIMHNQLDTTQINYEAVLDVLVKLRNTDLMAYFLTHYQIHADALEKAMIQACQQGSHDVVHLFIQHDECLVRSIQHDSSNHCQHPLCIAVRISDVNLTVTLHKSGAQLFNVPSSETTLHNTLCEYSLKDLCSRQDEFSDILPQLLPECIDQSSLTSALIAACKAGCTRAARLLVSKGADVNTCDAHGDSPLFAAIEERSSQLVTLLLEAGADPNTANNEHETALHLACDREHFEIASMLIDAGADTNSKLCSPLLIACMYNYIDIVELLLENGADSNRPSSEIDSSDFDGDYNDIDGNSNNTDGRIDGDSNYTDRDRNDTERESNDTEIVEPDLSSSEEEGSDIEGDYNDTDGDSDGTDGDSNDIDGDSTDIRSDNNDTDIVEPDWSSFEGDRNIILNSNDSEGDSNGIKGDNSMMNIVEPLLEHKTDANLCSSKGHILHVAHRYENYEVVRLLLEYGAEPSVLSGIGLKTACELGYTEVAQHIIHESHVSPDVLEQCIESAKKNGFLEAALEAIMAISEQDVKDQCIHLVLALFSGETSILTDTTQEPPGNVSDDMSLWTCLEKRNIPRMRELIKLGHDVNIPNITGRSLLQECIQQRITHVIPDLCASQIHTDHRDTAGRTALFYSLTCPDMHPVHGESISVFEFLASKGADMNVRDYFGRSALHEWQPVSDGLKHGPSLEKLLKYIDISSTDHKGQTALHLAVLNNNVLAVRQLLKHGADMEAHDINHITPLFLAHNTHKHAILHALQEDYVDNEYKEQNTTSGTEDHRQCVYTSSDKSKNHRLVSALKEVFHERTQYTQTDYFKNKYETQVYYTMKRSIQEEMMSFIKTLLQMLQDINAMVIQEEPVLSFTPRLSGSLAEGTKVIALDEVDILCVFDDDSWKQITLSQVSSDAHTQDNLSFVQIGSMSTKHQTLLNDGFVSKQKLLHRLYSLIRKVLPVVLKNIKSLYMIDVKNAVGNDHSLACLSMVWHGQELPWQEFTVDIVPAIPVTLEQLPDVTRQAMSHSLIIQDLFIVPKTGTFDQSQSDVAFRLSFSSTERDLFTVMPAALKQGYMLTKVLMHDCITIDDIPSGVCSYNLKTAAFECFKSKTPNWEDLIKEAHKKAENQAISDDVVTCAQNILQKVEHCIGEKHQDSFFLRGCNLIEHSIDKDDYRQILYVKYCIAVLSDTNEAAWEQLAECVAQQVHKQKNMQKSYFEEEINTLLDMGLKSQMDDILGDMINLGHVEGVRMMLERGASASLVAQSDNTAMFKVVEDSIKGKFIIYIYEVLETWVF